MEMSYGSPTAAYALFLHFYGDYVFEYVWNLVGLCFSLGLMIRKCLITLLKVVLAEMRVGRCYASFLQL